MKLLYDSNNSKILGAQALGESGVARRIDVISAFIQMGDSVYDLEEAELCYAPQFGATKDLVNLAGMIAANQLRGMHPLAKWEELLESHVQVSEDQDEASQLLLYWTIRSHRLSLSTCGPNRKFSRNIFRTQ